MLTPSEIKSHGIVGAGGAGFPTYVKSSGRVGTFLVNAAECEPLLHKDKEIIKKYPRVFLKGIKTAVTLLESSQAIIALKAKYKEILELLKPLPPYLSYHLMDDFYPAGDEFVLVHEVTGRVMAPGSIPLSVDVMVKNVETVYNLGKESPVITKFLSLAGDLKEPVSYEVPIGVSLREVLWGAGVEKPENYFILSGGVMMGTPLADLEQPVTKTLGGLILLNPEHPLARRYQRTVKAQNRIGRSSCDQCCFCTELCPRYLLGHPVIPHLAMRNLQFGEQNQSLYYARYCCECNLCSLVSCPEELDPKTVCAQNKQFKPDGSFKIPDKGPHPLQKERRTPLSRLFSKLHLNGFINKAPLKPFPIEPQRVKILLKQHIGVEALPLVKIGDTVKPGDKIAQIPEDKLGADLHASIAGRVTHIGREIIIEKR